MAHALVHEDLIRVKALHLPAVGMAETVRGETLRDRAPARLRAALGVAAADQNPGRHSQDLWIKSVALVSLTQSATGVNADMSGSSSLGEKGEDSG